MTSCLRLLSVCLMAGCCGVAASARGETAGLLRPTIAEDEAQVEEVEEPAVVPSLTIAPEEEQAPLKTIRPIIEPYAAPGIKLGGMALYPELETGTVYTSNVARSAANAKSDVGLSLRPSVRFESDWVRHSWTGQASGNFTAYLENNDFNSAQILDSFREPYLRIGAADRIRRHAVICPRGESWMAARL